jgi:hypothetical protein
MLLASSHGGSATAHTPCCCVPAAAARTSRPWLSPSGEGRAVHACPRGCGAPTVLIKLPASAGDDCTAAVASVVHSLRVALRPRGASASVAATRSAAVSLEAIRVKAPPFLPCPRLSAVNSVNSEAVHYWRCRPLLAYDVQLLAAPALGSRSRASTAELLQPSCYSRAATAELLQPSSTVSIRSASDAASVASARTGGPARGTAWRRRRIVLQNSQGLPALVARPGSTTASRLPPRRARCSPEQCRQRAE